MGLFEMVIAIVAISVGAGVLTNYLKLKKNRRGDSDSDAKIAQMQSEVDRLKDRVRVLEKITTDSETRLHDEISRLA